MTVQDLVRLLEDLPDDTVVFIAAVAMPDEPVGCVSIANNVDGSQAVYLSPRPMPTGKGT